MLYFCDYSDLCKAQTCLYFFVQEQKIKCPHEGCLYLGRPKFLERHNNKCHSVKEVEKPEEDEQIEEAVAVVTSNEEQAKEAASAEQTTPMVSC